MHSDLFGFFLFASADLSQDPDYKEFEQFIQTYGRRYNTFSEFSGRFTIFKQNLRKIELRNSRGNEKHGVNQFADLDVDEFKAQYLGYKAGNRKLEMKPGYESEPQKLNATTSSIDWRTKGILTPVKNQGQCGSCWAFSATEQLEAQYAQTYGKVNVLAPQQIVSCDTTCDGCSGGNPINAWFYVQGYGGQDSESSYPYVSGTTQQTGTCAAKKSSVTEDVSSSVGYYISQTASQESNMLKEITEMPMSVCVDAELWQTYTSGIITSSSGCGTTIDHAVQAVGYSSPGNYWIVRNSWGPSWGEGGYVYVQAGANVCGIASQATITAPATIAALHDSMN